MANGSTMAAAQVQDQLTLTSSDGVDITVGKFLIAVTHSLAFF
jgi:hypothetical protein